MIYPESEYMRVLLDAVNKRRAARGVAEWLMPPGPSRAHMIAIRDWIKFELQGSIWWADGFAIAAEGGVTEWLEANEPYADLERRFLPKLTWSAELFGILEIGRVVSGGTFDGEPRLTAELDNGTLSRWHTHSIYDELFKIVCAMDKGAPELDIPDSGSFAWVGESGWESTWNAAKSAAVAASSLQGSLGNARFSSFSRGQTRDDPVEYKADYRQLGESLVKQLSAYFDLGTGSVETAHCFARATTPEGASYNGFGWMPGSALQWSSIGQLDAAGELNLFVDGEAGPVIWPEPGEMYAGSIHRGGTRFSACAVIDFDFLDPASVEGAP